VLVLSAVQHSITPLLHRSGSLIFHRGQDVWVWRFTRFRIANHNMIMEKEFMQSEPASKKMLWAGRTLSALPVLLLLFSASIKLMKPPGLEEGFAHLGYPMSLALGLGILEIACTVICVIPRTSILGAILLTGYLGGARFSHLRTEHAFFEIIILIGFVWGRCIVV